ncbi:MAG: MFS transporter [Myxococcales bacterium]
MDAAPTLSRLVGVVRRNAGFRRLYTANAVSQVGDWLNVVALLSLLLELTGQGEAVALVYLTRFVPFFLVGPSAGVLADRISRRGILVTCDLLRAGLVLCLLFVRSPDQVWIVYLVMTAHAIASAFFEPAQAATVPNLVSREELVFASALENSLWSIAVAVGSAVGGIILALVGRDVAFLCDAASFVASALFLRGLPTGVARRDQPRETLAAEREASEPESSGFVNLLGLAELREGARYVAGHRRVRALVITDSCFGLTLGGVLVLLAFFGEQVFARGSGSGIAVLYTARGIGSFLGPLVAFRLGGHDQRALRRGILWAFCTILVCYIGFALSPSLWVAAAFLAVANAGGSTLWTYGSALTHQIVPDEVRGRVAAAHMGGMTLAMSGSTFLVGFLLDRGIGARPLMGACGLVAVAPIAFWLAVQPAFEAVDRHETGR